MDDQSDFKTRKVVACQALLRHQEILTPEIMENYDKKDSATTIKILVKVAIDNVASENGEDIKSSSLSLIKKGLSVQDMESPVIKDCLKHLRDHGINSEQEKTSLEIMSLLPDLYSQIIKVSRKINKIL